MNGGFYSGSNKSPSLFPTICIDRQKWSAFVLYYFGFPDSSSLGDFGRFEDQILSCHTGELLSAPSYLDYFLVFNP